MTRSEHCHCIPYTEGVSAFSPGLVAAATYPGSAFQRSSNPKGVVAGTSISDRRPSSIRRNPVRVVGLSPHVPRVAPSAQPWAEGRSPVGAVTEFECVLCSSLSNPKGHTIQRSHLVIPRYNPRMPRLSRKLRILKWSGVAACLGIAILFALSLRWNVVWGSSRGQYHFAVSRGCIFYLYFPGQSTDLPQDFHIVRWRNTRGLRWRPYTSQGTSSFYLIPLWMLFVPCLVPTCYLFWRDRRPPPGHCRQCGYNLTGNVSGRCPECGREIDREV